jgi:hypothetical protein
MANADEVGTSWWYRQPSATQRMVPVDEQRMAADVLHQFRVDGGRGFVCRPAFNPSEICLMRWGINAGGRADEGFESSVATRNVVTLASLCRHLLQIRSRSDEQATTLDGRAHVYPATVSAAHALGTRCDLLLGSH